MKKTILTCALVALASPAMAFEMKPYVGIDYMHMNFELNNSYNDDGVTLDANTLLEDGFDGLHIHAGNRFHKNFGAEIGYFRTQEEDRTVPAGTTVGPGLVTAVPITTDVKFSGFTLDGMGYMPLGDGTIELIGTAGVTWIDADAEIEGFGSADEDEIGFRVGGGLQANLTDRISARALVRYQTADFQDIAENAFTYSAGLNLSF